jgi:hypothetical protein
MIYLMHLDFYILLSECPNNAQFSSANGMKYAVKNKNS